MKKSYLKGLKWGVSLLIIYVFIRISLDVFDVQLLKEYVKTILQFPMFVFMILFIYFVSFCLKAIAWKLYLQNRPRFLTCLLGIFYSLFVNHLIPIKVGDAVRIAVISKRDKHIKLREAVHSVFILRVIDMLILLVFSFIGLMYLKIEFNVPVLLIVFIALCFCAIILFFMKKKLRKMVVSLLQPIKASLFTYKGFAAVILVFISWLLEAAIVFGTAWMVKQPISVMESIWVNSMTVAGQVFQITPGGIANYETFMSLALQYIGIGLKEGYSIAIITHALKFFFSFLAGGVAIVLMPLTFETLKNWIKRRDVVE